MTTQVVVPKAESEYAYLGGCENVGSQGGYHNVQVHFPQLWAAESVQRWLRKRAPNTRAEYLCRFEKFLAWTAKENGAATPDQFLSWAKSQSDGTLVQDLIDKYADPLSSSQSHIVTALVRSFLGRNGYRSLPKIDWSTTMSFTEGYKRAEIQQLLTYLDSPLQKLYVLMGKDSGLRANDLLYIRYKHILPDLEAGGEFVSVRFEKERYLRKKAPGRTFLGPNSVSLLKQLISSGTVSRDPEARILPFIYRTIVKSLSLAKKKASLNPDIQPSHGLRKYFENCLDRVGMDHHKKLQLEGHSQGVRGAYTSQEVEELRELYKQAYQYLDLSEKGAVSNEVGALQQQVSEQAQYIESLKTQLAKNDADIPRLKEDLEQVKRFLEQLKTKLG